MLNWWLKTSAPGMIVRVIEVSQQQIRISADGDERILTPIMAANISVATLPSEDRVEPTSHQRLSELDPGEQAEVVGGLPFLPGA